MPTDGPGSLAAMTTAPVGTAVAGNPVLSQLARAVVAANLIDTLNGLQDVTLIAPDDAAFAALPGGPGPLLGNTPQLTAVLTHHVIAGRLTPDRLVGTHTTLDDDQVTISRAGDVYTISGDQTETGALATVVCGDVQTANATVYVVDQVLKPGKTG